MYEITLEGLIVCAVIAAVVAVLLLFLGVFIGIWKRNAAVSALSTEKNSLEQEKVRLQEKLAAEQANQCQLKENFAAQQQADRSNFERQKAELQKGFEEQKAELKENWVAQKSVFINEFKALSEEVLKSRSEEFQQRNQAEISKLLDPLSKDIEAFKRAFNDQHDKTSDKFVQFAEQLKMMNSNAQKLGQDAENLTKALRSDSKFQGNYGERQLERLLQYSGMEKGIHYATQQFIADETGKNIVGSEFGKDAERKKQPDVTIFLPDDKVIIIDSKVSLTAYVDYISAQDDAARTIALKRHIESVRKHCAELANKDYARNYTLAQKDKEVVPFVLMFMPNEGAYFAAVNSDRDLWDDAMKSNVMIVTATSLMAFLNIIQMGWRTYHLNKNCRDISQRAEMILTAMENFYREFDEINTGLEKAQRGLDAAKDAYNGSVAKFKTANGEKRGSVAYHIAQMRKLTCGGATSSSGMVNKFETAEEDCLEALPEKSLENPDAES